MTCILTMNMDGERANREWRENGESYSVHGFTDNMQILAKPGDNIEIIVYLCVRMCVYV